MHNSSSSKQEQIKKWCNSRKNNDNNNEQINSRFFIFKTESITRSELKAKVITRKWCTFSACVLTKKKSINKKQTQMCSNCSFYKSNFLQCSEHTRCTLQSAHIVYLQLYSDYIQTKSSILHSRLYVLSFLICSLFLLFFLLLYWSQRDHSSKGRHRFDKKMRI